MNDGNLTNNLFLGIEQDLLEKFLVLVRDKYPLADKANYFLERHGISGISVGITNQRDVLSHLVTFLSDPEKTTREDRAEQIADAEEHLRRSVIETYQIGVAKLEKLEPLVRDYKKTVLTISDSSLSGAPDLQAVNAQLARIQRLSESGREAKARNKWDERWEEGVKCFLDAVSEIDRAHEMLETYLFRAQQIIRERETKKTTRKQNTFAFFYFIAGAAISGVISYAIAVHGQESGGSTPTHNHQKHASAAHRPTQQQQSLPSPR